MSGATSVLQMVLSLAAVVAMILALAWMTRRLQGLRAPQTAELRVKASLSVGMKERVVLIEAAGQQFLLGVAPGQVRLISAVDPVLAAATPIATEVGAIPADATASKAGMPLSSAFAIQLNKLLSR